MSLVWVGIFAVWCFCLFLYGRVEKLEARIDELEDR